MSAAYFAGGCFWCITPVFREQKGVLSVTAGYAGGNEPNPTYEAVKHGLTHHRETIRVEYDPDRIPYSALLDLYLWSVDPYDGGGQFIDRGASYTLAIYWTDQAQYRQAKDALNALSDADPRPVCIALEPFRSFYPAEEAHQNYDLKHPSEFARELAISGRNDRKKER